MSLYKSLEKLINEAEEQADQSLLQKIKSILNLFPKIKIPSSVKELVTVLADNLIKMNQDDINKLQNAFIKLTESSSLNEGILDVIKNKINLGIVVMAFLILFGGSAEAAQHGHRILNHIKSEHVRRDFEKDVDEIKEDLKIFILKEVPTGAKEVLDKIKEGVEKTKEKIEKLVPPKEKNIQHIQQSKQSQLPTKEI